MSTIKYLRDSFTVHAKRRTDTPRYGMCADGYTKRSGAPTQWLIYVASMWRRTMCIQFSNVGSCFVAVNGERYYLDDCDLPTTEATLDRYDVYYAPECRVIDRVDAYCEAEACRMAVTRDRRYADRRGELYAVLNGTAISP